MGKKLSRVPYPYQGDERIIRKARKWKRKNGIRTMQRIQERDKNVPN
jgi:hypothetical protein